MNGMRARKSGLGKRLRDRRMRRGYHSRRRGSLSIWQRSLARRARRKHIRPSLRQHRSTLVGRFLQVRLSLKRGQRLLMHPNSHRPQTQIFSEEQHRLHNRPSRRSKIHYLISSKMRREGEESTTSAQAHHRFGKNRTTYYKSRYPGLT
ncbi:uncharacterized protein SEPMUDRAFT_87306 [Sphaerulina musiva SO2202]|uniref:Uncharacterized protein n=1 Tax=Sphaerulina musiva (strain SO2202) TaxID=692275 RepID=N1QL67_SPHMS|nr:uncharacterized protein SEPMUDRAFT_87306 [Sphaerulina musiva SO2202]EMF11936.1 hypothetical protein SEPMUDRAFT_87306 [Sphaerulina musiva SO2202]